MGCLDRNSQAARIGRLCPANELQSQFLGLLEDAEKHASTAAKVFQVDAIYTYFVIQLLGTKKSHGRILIQERSEACQPEAGTCSAYFS